MPAPTGRAGCWPPSSSAATAACSTCWAGPAAALAGREGFEAARARIEAAAVELSDVSRTLRDDVESWEDDPDRLAEVHERRRLLADLRRKYGEDLAAVMRLRRGGRGPAGRPRGRRGRGGAARGRAG